MIESINSEIGFLAFKCTSMEDFEVRERLSLPHHSYVNDFIQAGLCNDAQTTLMGEPIDPTMKGTFYLRTNAQSPYAMPFKSSSTDIIEYSTMHLVCLIFVTFWMNDCLK